MLMFTVEQDTGLG